MNVAAMMNADADGITKNLELTGVSTLDPRLQGIYNSRSDAQSVICYQCLFIARCVDSMFLLKNVSACAAAAAAARAPLLMLVLRAHGRVST
jgi:hypothetical protein